MNGSPYSWGMGNPINTIDPDGRNVYYINENGEVRLAKKEDGAHRFIGSDGTELDALGKDASFVGGALATAGTNSDVWQSLGDTEQANNLRTTAGLYNSQQLKNTFNESADIITGLGGLRQLFKQGYKGLLKYFGDDVVEQGVKGSSRSLLGWDELGQRAIMSADELHLATSSNGQVFRAVIQNVESAYGHNTLALFKESQSTSSCIWCKDFRNKRYRDN